MGSPLPEGAKTGWKYSIWICLCIEIYPCQGEEESSCITACSGIYSIFPYFSGVAETDTLFRQGQ